MTREEALALVEKHTKNKNLVRHMLAVEACMRALAKHFYPKDTELVEVWALAGLLHDADYEVVGKNTKRHTHQTLEWLADHDVSEEIKNAILAHGWKWVEGAPIPKSKMEWALYTCDELTGLIVAVALVKDKKISSVTVDSVMKKWGSKSFAAGANREQIALCEEKLGIKLEEFIEICLKAMQSISSDLGL